MDRYDGEYDVQDVVRKCFMDQASKGKIGIRPLVGNSDVDEIENHILYDDDFYYVTDSTLRTVCAPLLTTVSFVQLKNEMASSGMVDCNDGNLKNFTKKKLIWRSFGWQGASTVCLDKEGSLNDKRRTLTGRYWGGYKMLKVGNLQNGTDVFLSDKSPNRHISVLGISGSGKTVRLRELIRNVVENGETALIF